MHMDKTVTELLNLAKKCWKRRERKGGGVVTEENLSSLERKAAKFQENTRVDIAI